MTREACTARHERICRLRLEGLTLQVIAWRVGVSIKQVQFVLTRYRVYRRQP